MEREVGPLSPLETTIIHLVGTKGTSFHLPLTERQYEHFKGAESLGPVEGSTFAERLVELFQLVKEHGIYYPLFPPTGTQRKSVFESDSKVEEGRATGIPATIRVYTLGVFRLERRSGSEWLTVTDPEWNQHWVHVLLEYLLSVTGRRAGREQIGDAIWPDLGIEHAGKRLDRAEQGLLQVFEPLRDELAPSSYLFTESGMLLLAGQQYLWVDADAFEFLLAQARSSNDRIDKEGLLEEALALYRGDFLPEEHTLEVTLERRGHLVRHFKGILLEIATLRIQREALSEAVDPLRKLLSMDPTHEAAVQLLLRVHTQLGQRGEALRVYKRLATALQQEYAMNPLPDTRSLYEAIRSGAWTPSERAYDTTSATGGERMPLNEGEDTGATSVRPLAPDMLIGRSNRRPLIGRSQELESIFTLLSAIEHSVKEKLSSRRASHSSLSFDAQRVPQCVLLQGEKGVGKTRVAEEVAHEAQKRGWSVLWSRTHMQGVNTSCQIWIEALRQVFSQYAWLREEVSKEPLVYQPLSTLLPELHDVVPKVDFPVPMRAEQEQLHVREATRMLLARITKDTPLLIVLDDLQWADSGSCELLAYLVRHIYGQPILFVGTYCEHELPPEHALRLMLIDLQRDHAVETISLELLNSEQIESLVIQTALEAVSESMKRQIQKYASGNPYLAEELTRHFAARDAGTLLPEGIRAMFDLRTAQLSGECQTLLSTASALGDTFEFASICALAASSSDDIDDDHVLTLLEEALHAGILSEEITGSRAYYHFRQVIFVSYLFENLSTARRTYLQTRIADGAQQGEGTR